MRPDAGRYLKPMPNESWRDFERRCAHAEGREPRLELTHPGAKQHLDVTDASLDEAVRGLAELKWLVADLKLHLLHREFAAKAYNRNQPRVPAGNPDGGQWTSEGSDELRPIPAQFTPRSPSPYMDDFVVQGGRRLGTFGPGVSIAVSAGVRDEEYFDPERGITTISLSGIGHVLIEQEHADRIIVLPVGTVADPDRGLSVLIDVNGNVRVRRTRGA